MRTLMALGLVGLVSCGGGDGGATGGNAPPANLLGVWCARFFDPNFGNAQVELILDPTSGISFQEQYVYQAGSVISIFGNFRAFVDGLGTSTLRLDTAGGYPDVDQFGSPIRYPAETYCYQLVDDNHLNLFLGFVNCP